MATKYTFLEDPYGLSPLWAATLDIYVEFAKLCDKYGMQYYVTDGNAIGAVRHKGFIPWDDDFDVSMPRPDYDKFLAHLNELPRHLKFVNWRNTPEFDAIYGKIQDSREEVVRDVEAKTGMKLSNGIFIDIFPVDGYSARWSYALSDRLMNFFIEKVERYKKTRFCSHTPKGKCAWVLGAILSLIFRKLNNSRDFASYYDVRARRIKFGTTSVSARASLKKALTLFYPQSCWGDGVWVEYNGITIPIPSDFDSYLKVEYPNYMQLPPENERHPTHGHDYRVAWYLGPTEERQV